MLFIQLIVNYKSAQEKFFNKTSTKRNSLLTFVSVSPVNYHATWIQQELAR